MKYFYPMLLLALGFSQPANAGTALQLSLPLACTPGKDCFIQQYVDVQPGPGEKDYRCGTATYEGHDGTDFRVLSIAAAAAGVPVLAAAAGRVKGTRDGMEDHLIATREDEALVKGRECGNGVLIDHGDGWETQYCHMRRGSLKVGEGDSVAAGTPLGLVGYSGDAAFAHLHLSVRQNGKAVDPFLGTSVDGTCVSNGATPAASLWAAGVREQLAYRDAAIIEAGFAASPVSPEQAEQGAIAMPEAQSSALVFYARLINMRSGDSLRLSVGRARRLFGEHQGRAASARQSAICRFRRPKANGRSLAGRLISGAGRRDPRRRRGERGKGSAAPAVTCGLPLHWSFCRISEAAELLLFRLHRQRQMAPNRREACLRRSPTASPDGTLRHGQDAD